MRCARSTICLAAGITIPACYGWFRFHCPCVGRPDPPSKHPRRPGPGAGVAGRRGRVALPSGRGPCICTCTCFCWGWWLQVESGWASWGSTIPSHHPSKVPSNQRLAANVSFPFFPPLSCPFLPLHLINTLAIIHTWLHVEGASSPSLAAGRMRSC